MTCIHDKLYKCQVKMADIWNILDHGNAFMIKYINLDVAYKKIKTKKDQTYKCKHMIIRFPK